VSWAAGGCDRGGFGVVSRLYPARGEGVRPTKVGLFISPKNNRKIKDFL
jgi:hypothetical protein